MKKKGYKKGGVTKKMAGGAMKKKKACGNEIRWKNAYGQKEWEECPSICG